MFLFILNNVERKGKDDDDCWVVGSGVYALCSALPTDRLAHDPRKGARMVPFIPVIHRLWMKSPACARAQKAALSGRSAAT